jgi:tetratricopeptide (TPR) repeat protein
LNLTDTIVFQISEALARGGEDALREAAGLVDALTEALPEWDLLARTIFNVAFHCEALGDDELCAGLYRRSLASAVLDCNIHAGCWFRLGGCLTRLGAWLPAMQAFRNAIATGRDWPHMTDQASLQLAELCCAAEEFEAAEALLDRLCASSIQEVRQPRVRLVRTKCLIRLSRPADAAIDLAYVRAHGNPDETLEAEQILASLQEAAGDRHGAIACYQRILAHPGAGNAMKAAASFRIESLA